MSGRLATKPTTSLALFAISKIVISSEAPQFKILTLSLLLMSCMTLGKLFNLSLQMRKLRLGVLI